MEKYVLLKKHMKKLKEFQQIKMEVLALEEYKVELSIQAKEDYKSIIRYIKYKLLEPIIAERYAELIKNELNTLKYNPQNLLLLIMT